MAVKWFLPEPHADAARSLLRAEVGNVLWKRWRRGDLDAATVDAAFADFGHFPLEIHSSKSLLERAWGIARDAGLTVYDGLYAALALAQGAPRVTADRRLYEMLRGATPSPECVWVGDVGFGST